jgi:hypothetical protein
MPHLKNFLSLKANLDVCAGKSIHTDRLRTGNPKFQARNPKQIQISNVSMIKTHGLGKRPRTVMAD